MNIKKRKRYAVLSLVAFLLIVFAVWIAYENTSITVTEISVSSKEIPKEFSGFRIAQISDLHNAEFGDGNKELLELLESTAPDIIVLTGDIIDSRRTNIDIAADFVCEAAKTAPTYYVTGNHEERLSEEYQLFEESMIAAGVHLLRGESEIIERNGKSLCIAGIDDRSYYAADDGSYPDSVITDTLSSIIPDDIYTVLLSHRPEMFDLYVQSKADLVFCGHAHGGQFRIPFIGGVYAPGQGLFPEYDSGLYTEDNTSMIVSRGLGASLFPFRINNRPEIVIAELTAE